MSHTLHSDSEIGTAQLAQLAEDTGPGVDNLRPAVPVPRQHALGTQPVTDAAGLAIAWIQLELQLLFFCHDNLLIPSAKGYILIDKEIIPQNRLYEKYQKENQSIY